MEDLILKKFIAICLCLFLIINCIPAWALDLNGYTSEEELRKAILGDEKWLVQFPNGLFNFVGTQFEMSENQEFLEIPIVRQGGTNGKVSVVLKAIDVSARYGEDYIIRIYDNSFENEIKSDENNFALIDAIGNTQINISDDSLDKGNNDNEESFNFENENQSKYLNASAVTSSGIAIGDNGINSLRKARNTYFGKESDRPDWKSLDEKTVEELKAEYDKFLSSMPGTEALIEFDEGEYIKYIYIIPLNDKFSESQEQFMLALENPDGGASRGEFYMSYVNINDDEELEKSQFEIIGYSVDTENIYNAVTNSAITVENIDKNTTGTATVIVKRVGGLNRYASVIVGTEEGTAVPGADYVAGIGEVFFTPGMSEQKVLVNILYNSERKTDRNFNISLDVTNENVNPLTSSVSVIIPAVEDSIDIIDTEKSSNIVLAKLKSEEKPENINAEKLTEFGYALSQGKWVITADDFLKNGQLEVQNNGTYPYAIGSNGIGYNYTPLYFVSRVQSITLGFGSLGGVDNISYYYYNPAGDKTTQNGGFFVSYLNGSNYLKDLDISPGCGGNVMDYVLKNTGILSDKKWFAPTRISLYAFSQYKINNKPSYFDITLNLREYNTEILPAEKIERKKYSISDGKLSSGEKYKDYSPGSLYIKAVHSNVYNYQELPVNPTVYRSDRIEFGYNYSEDNPDGRYAKFKGFEIKCGSKWIGFEGTELIMDAKFFNTPDIYNAIKDGKIEIRPTFSKIPAEVIIKYEDSNNGLLINAPDKNSGNKNYMIFSNKDYFGDNTSFAKIYTGDVLMSLEAKANYTSKPPVWVSYGASGHFEESPAYLSPESIIVTETDGGTKINYILENSTSQLELKFAEALLQIVAQPNIYKHGVGDVLYKLDGKSFDRDKFVVEMERVYDEGDGTLPINSNPLLEMEFNYIFNSDFPDIGGAERKSFGEPVKAQLNIYKNDGSLRSSYEIPYNEGAFRFSAKPKELGWQLDDFAGVFIQGSGKLENTQMSTPEFIIDFLSNSADAITVTLPSDEDNPPILAGKIYKPILINSANPLQYYKMNSVNNSGYITRWMDFSPDLNSDGEVSAEERKNIESRILALNKDIKKLSDVWDSNVYWGNYYVYKPAFFNPSKIYYSFEKLPVGTAQWSVEVSLYEQYRTVLNPNKLSDEIAVKDAEFYIAGKRVSDSQGSDEADGVYKHRDPLYQLGNYYQTQVIHKGEVFSFASVAGIAKKVVINSTELMFPYDFRATINSGSKSEDQKLNEVNNTVWIRDADTNFTYRINGGKSGVRATDSIIRIYDTKGNVFLEQRSGEPTKEEFSYTINSYKTGIKPGYTMTIAGLITDVDGKVLKEFPEIRVGLVFTKELNMLSLLSSFQTFNQPTVKMLGKLNNRYDLGMNTNLLKSETQIYTDKNGNQRKIKTISFGYSDEYKKKFTENAKDTEEGKKRNDEVLKEETKNDNKQNLIKTVDEASKDADKKQEKKNSGGGDFNMKYEISLLLTLELGQIKQEGGLYTDDGYHYFSSLVLMAKATADYTKSNTFMTPIGIPVKVTLSAGGTAAVVMASDVDHEDPYNEKYRLDGSGNISINPANYNIYAKFIISPTVTLSAAAGFDSIDLEISGTADFDFQFTAPIRGDTEKSSGSGGMVISSKLKLKILFVQKKWTLYKGERIEFFSYGKSYQDSIYSILNNPYKDYLYESVDDISDDDIMPRDYLDERGAWNDYDDEDLPHGVKNGNENVLLTGAFPNSQTKLIAIDNNKFLLLFIEDDTSRDVRNRATLMYSIIDGENATQPMPVDSDGTWDEDPNAFFINGKVLVTWSDAYRAFTPDDKQIDVLSLMDISGAWFDIDTESFEDKFCITKTVVGGDVYRDSSPKIAYDSDIMRLMVYYLKTDYTDRWEVGYLLSDDGIPFLEAPSPLYGDIINGYSVMAYRYADYNMADGEFIWNETYEAGEDLDSEKFYGQRFLNLTPVAEIEETEYDIEDETISIGEGADAQIYTLTHTGTIQVVKEYKGYDDPRIIETTVASYDSEAIFAYIIDKDSDLKTTTDQQLYIQRYDYTDNTFSKPIEITSIGTQNKQPNFINADNELYLYWIQEGKIVYTCISKLLHAGMKVVIEPISMKEVYIIDKSNVSKTAHILTAVENDNDIEEFSIMSDNNNIYAMWVESCISAKNELEVESQGIEGVENINQEKQIFLACSLIGEDSERLAWSEPVQITDDKAQSFRSLSFVPVGKDSFTVAYLRYIQKYDSEEGYFTSANSLHTLAVNEFYLSSDPELGEILISEELPKAGQTVSVISTIKNTGLSPFDKYSLQFFVSKNGEIISSYENMDKDISHILGGSTETIYGSFTMPEDLRDVNELKTGYAIKDEKGTILLTKEKEIELKPELVIEVGECEIIDADTVAVKLYIRNLGNKAYDDNFEVLSKSNTIHRGRAFIEADEMSSISLNLNVRDIDFSEVKLDEYGGIYDFINLDFKFGGFYAKTEVQRRLSARDYEQLQSIESFNILFGGRRIADMNNVYIAYDDVAALQAEVIKDKITYTDGMIPENMELVWNSSNTNVVTVLSNGTLLPMSKGKAIVTASLRPVSTNSVSYSDGTFDIRSNSHKLPNGAKKEIRVIVNVNDYSDDKDNASENNHSGGNISGNIICDEKLEGDKLILTLDGNNLAKILEDINESLTINSKKDYDIKHIELRLTADNIKAFEKSNIKNLVIDTLVGTINFDRKAIDTIIEKSSGNSVSISFNVNLRDIDIYLKTQDMIIEDLNGGTMLVSIYFEPDEDMDESGIVVYKTEPIDKTIVKLSAYFSEMKKILFRTTKTGKFSIEYNGVNFKDNLGWAEYYIKFLSSRGIVFGTGDGIFDKDKKVSRAEFITMLSRLIDETYLENEQSYFNDVRSGAWYEKAVNWAFKNNIIKGTDNNEFLPQKPISREEMAVILYRFIQYAEFKLSYGPYEEFKDEEYFSNWSIEAINSIKSLGIINGTGEGNFKPKEFSSRAESAKVIAQILYFYLK